CPGLRQGGVLNIVRHAIEMRASPDSIPESVEIDLSGYNVGDSVHISSATLPGDVELTITDRDFTVATIAAPSVNIEIDETGAEEGVDAEAAPAEETSEE
ncbi:MAG: 50S ribosomal protein L25, partial [Rhodospirillales bacterium]